MAARSNRGHFRSLLNQGVVCNTPGPTGHGCRYPQLILLGFLLPLKDSRPADQFTTLTDYSMFEYFQQPSLLQLLLVICALCAGYALSKKYLECRVC